MRVVLLALFVFSVPTLGILLGHDTDQGEFPFVVELFSRTQTLCVGTIYNEFWILTAADCTYDTRSFNIRAGSVLRHGYSLNKTGGFSLTGGVSSIELFRSEEGIDIAVDKIIQHPKYRPFSNKNNIALVKLKSPLSFNDNIRPVELPHSKRRPNNGTYTALVGWGIDLHDNIKMLKYPEIQQAITVEVMRRQGKCNDPGIICTYAQPVQGPCFGDAGGPVVIKGVQYGIITYLLRREKICQFSDPWAHTFIPHFTSFIEKYAV